MNEESYLAATSLVSKTYVNQGRDARKNHEKSIQILMQQVSYWCFIDMERRVRTAVFPHSTNFQRKDGKIVEYGCYLMSLPWWTATISLVWRTFECMGCDDRVVIGCWLSGSDVFRECRCRWERSKSCLKACGGKTFLVSAVSDCCMPCVGDICRDIGEKRFWLVYTPSIDVALAMELAGLGMCLQCSPKRQALRS